jgi:hypothetical protein
MKNDLNDEELQRLLEEAGPSFQPPFTSQPVQDELAAYQHLFTALNQSPPVSLSANFSAGVVERIHIQQRRSASRRFYAVLIALFLLGLALSFAGGGLVEYRSSQLVLQTLFQTKSWLLFGLACLLIIRILDHQLIKKRIALLR